MQKIERTMTIDEILPSQEHYWALTEGSKLARFGGTLRPADSGVLLFANQERAEVFLMGITGESGSRSDPAAEQIRQAGYKPVKVSAAEVVELARQDNLCTVVRRAGKFYIQVFGRFTEGRPKLSARDRAERRKRK